ncbi:MAG: hypothetical protein HW421_1049 [Ignavibacteria bacterium]|nr:hypothetical protein [Ignavibacteria bacterium]
MKKIIETVIFIFLIVGNIFAFSGKGSGTKDDPYQITNVYQLQEVGKDIGYFILMNDIDASETRNWDSGRGFKPGCCISEFDGQGFIIKNLYINRPDDGCVGLFCIMGGYIPSIVKRLGIENCDITGGFQVGAICGLVVGTAAFWECYSTGTVRGKYLVGGLCGNFSGGINNSFSTCNVISENYVGGLTGICSLDEGGSFIYYCYFAGRLEGQSTRGLLSSDGTGGPVSISCSYYDSLVIGTTHPPITDKSYGKSTIEMMKRSTYGWDFDSVWCIDEGKDYPKLRIFDRCITTSFIEPSIDLLINANAYPNPFSSHITFKYYLKEPEFVTITIFNTLGEKLEIIVNEFIAAGEHKAIFISDNYPTGIYFYSIQIGKSINFNKIQLIR